jgi:dUTP pyrophosphatase
MIAGSIEINFKKLDPRAIIPTFAHEGDSGLDLCSLHEYIIKPGECTMVETGLSVEVVSHGDLTSFTFEIQVRPRSGLAMKEGITIINSPATIDSNFRGHCKFPLTKITNGEYKLKVGERFAQAVVCPIFSSPMVSIQEVETLSSSIRGEQGFGSTGELYSLKHSI